MNYRTCYGCKIDPSTCARRIGLRDALRGLGIRSVSFRCDDRAPVFNPGDRATVTWRFPIDYEEFDVEFAVTVIEERKPGRYYVRVDDGRSLEGDDWPSCPNDLTGGGHANVSFTRLKPLDEERRKVCPACGWVEGLAVVCYASSYHVPKGCVEVPAP